jgi:glutamate racemase
MTQPVVFIDSGVGGLPYFQAFRDAAPSIPAYYVADHANFPYGPKDKNVLSGLLVSLVRRLQKAFDPRLVVVACNTASVSALQDLRDSFPELPFVGTVPAVKPAVLESRNGRVGVLATERTLADPYIYGLAKTYAPQCTLFPLPAPELVCFVENGYLDSTPEDRQSIIEPYVRAFRAWDVDTIVLGCTHFLFLVDDFRSILQDEFRLFDSRDGVAHRAISSLGIEGGASRPDGGGTEDAGKERSPAVRFFISGGPDIPPPLRRFSQRYGLAVEMLP